jgi:ribosomal protein S15P/S13E
MPKKSEKKAEEKAETKEESKKSKKVSQEEFEKKVIELAEKGLTSEKIGETLRREGIHPKEFNKKISKILGSKYINPDLKNIEKKLEGLKKHFEKNKGDKRAMRDKERTSAKVRRLKKYLSR